MKKLLLASIFMIGISGIVSAQTQSSEMLRAKKEAYKRDNNKPAISNAANKTVTPASTAVAPKELTDAEKAKLIEMKKAKAVVPANKTKTN